MLLLSTRYGYSQFFMVRLKTKSTVLTTAAFGVRSLLLTVIMVLYEFFLKFFMGRFVLSSVVIFLLPLLARLFVSCSILAVFKREHN